MKQPVDQHRLTYTIYMYIYIYIYIYIYNTIYMYIYTKILEVNLFAIAYRLFHRDFSPINRTYCMGTHFFLQLYMYFVLIWEGFMNG